MVFSVEGARTVNAVHPIVQEKRADPVCVDVHLDDISKPVP